MPTAAFAARVGRAPDLDEHLPTRVRRSRINLADKPDETGRIRVRLDQRTIVLIKSMDKFAYWKERYPKAEVLDQPAKGRKQ